MYIYFLNQPTLALCFTLQNFFSMFSTSGLKIQSLSVILEDSPDALTAKKLLYFYLASMEPAMLASCFSMCNNFIREVFHQQMFPGCLLVSCACLMSYSGNQAHYDLSPTIPRLKSFLGVSTLSEVHNVLLPTTSSTVHLVWIEETVNHPPSLILWASERIKHQQSSSRNWC